MKSAEEEETKSHLKALTERRDDIVARIVSGQNLDSIAADYEVAAKIPPPLSILFGAQFINALAGLDDPDARQLAVLSASSQHVDSSIPAREFLKQLNAKKTIYQAARCIARRMDRPKGAKGIMVLSLAYLYFLPYEEQFSYAAARAKGLVSGALEGSIPGFGLLSTIYDIGSGAASGATDFFTAHLSELCESFDQPSAFAIRLTDITQYGARQLEASWYLSVTGLLAEENKVKQCVFFPEGEESREWVDNWLDVLPLACIAEGIIFETRVPAAAPTPQG